MNSSSSSGGNWHARNNLTIGLSLLDGVELDYKLDLEDILNKVLLREIEVRAKDPREDDRRTTLEPTFGLNSCWLRQRKLAGWVFDRNSHPFNLTTQANHQNPRHPTAQTAETKKFGLPEGLIVCLSSYVNAVPVQLRPIQWVLMLEFPTLPL